MFYIFMHQTTKLCFMGFTVSHKRFQPCVHIPPSNFIHLWNLINNIIKTKIIKNLTIKHVSYQFFYVLSNNQTVCKYQDLFVTLKCIRRSMNIANTKMLLQVTYNEFVTIQFLTYLTTHCTIEGILDQIQAFFSFL